MGHEPSGHKPVRLVSCNAYALTQLVQNLDLERSGGNGVQWRLSWLVMTCFLYSLCLGHPSKPALRRGSMLDVMEQQRCYAQAVTLKQSYAAPTPMES